MWSNSEKYGKNPSERVQSYLKELENSGFSTKNLKDLKSMMSADDSDIFDVLAHFII